MLEQKLELLDRVADELLDQETLTKEEFVVITSQPNVAAAWSLCHGRWCLWDTSDVFSTQMYQKTTVLFDRLKNRREGDVWDLEFITGILDNFADRRIVNVANPWKKMVLNLEIQPSTIEPCKSALGGKIRGRLDLMNGPLVADLTGSLIRTRKSVVIDNVGQLKNRCERKTEKGMNDQKKNKDVENRMKKHRHNEHVTEVKCFRRKEKS